jgi:ABC-2 type transport system permease protein
MIWLIVRISALRLWHNKAELALTFIVPIFFFSIFAMIFGSRERSGATASIKVAVADNAKSAASEELIEQLRTNGTLRFIDGASQTSAESQLELVDSRMAERLVREGTASVAIVLESQMIEKDKEKSLTARLLTDSSDQVAPKMVLAIVQQLLAQQSFEQLRDAAASPAKNMPTTTAISNPIPVKENNIRGVPIPNEAQVPAPAFEPPVMKDWVLPEVKVLDVVGGQKKNPIVAMYASGIAVMFLLFSVVGGGGALLDEKESSTLERLLASQLTLDELLMGKWLYLMLLGTLQTTLMFIWGQLVFGVELAQHWDGFLMMTLVTSSAASSLSLFLATMCSTRAQLNWVSVVLVLGMSALGGSMVPRYLMSERIREIGLLTFNAWALDGYNKVFWRNLPIQSLWPQLGVLLLAGLGFMIAARITARRWEKI